MKRKIVFLLSVLLLVSAMSPITAFAHGHRRSAAAIQDEPYATCNIDGCHNVSVHWHDGVCYNGHWISDGCDYHQVCTVEDCTYTTHHYHNGVAYIPQNNSNALCSYENCHIAEAHEHDDACYAGHWPDDGHGYHQVCTVRGCTLSTVHNHSGVTCFPSGRVGTGGHHSGGHGGRGHH